LLLLLQNCLDFSGLLVQVVGYTKLVLLGFSLFSAIASFWLPKPPTLIQ